MQSCLDALKHIPIKTVIDIGVYHETFALRTNYPDAMHYLWEPIKANHETIIQNYADVTHKLVGFGASNKNETKTILPYRNEQTEIQCVRVDSIVRDDEGPFLIKIDTDGSDVEALEGCRSLLPNCEILILESVIKDIGKYHSMLTEHGFFLRDIVDLCYLKNTLYQVDLVFTRQQPAEIAIDENDYSQF